MNIYYLKKFRKWAKESVKMCANEYSINKYDVFVNREWRKRYLDFEKAKEVLINARRHYILLWCWKKRTEKLNKQFAKL